VIQSGDRQDDDWRNGEEMKERAEKPCKSKRNQMQIQKRASDHKKNAKTRIRMAYVFKTAVLLCELINRDKCSPQLVLVRYWIYWNTEHRYYQYMDEQPPIADTSNRLMAAPS